MISKPDKMRKIRVVLVNLMHRYMIGNCWNIRKLWWTSVQAEILATVCKKNFADRQEEIKTALREVWWQKKAVREGKVME